MINNITGGTGNHAGDFPPINFKEVLLSNADASPEKLVVLITAYATTHKVSTET